MAPIILLCHTPATRGPLYGEAALAGLRALGTVRLHEGEAPLTGEALAEAARGACVVVSDRMTPGPAALFAARPELVAFVRVAVDARSVDVAAASAAGVLVTRAGPGFVDAVTELALALMLDLARGVSAAARGWREGAPPPAVAMGRELRGATVGIVGYGSIGRRLAAVLGALGMVVLVADPHVTVEAAEGGPHQVSYERLLAEAEFVVLLAVATPATKNLLDAAALARMRPDAFVLNLSRGELVDEAALEAALREGRIAGAALDVGSGPDQTPPPRLALLPGVVATPHIGGLTPQSVASQSLESVAQVAAVLRGEVPHGAINPQAWGRRELLG